MTREEAIRHIRDVIAENNSIKPNIVIFEQEKEALYMAIEALQNLSKPNNELKGSDLISRQDAITSIKEEYFPSVDDYGEGYNEALNKAIWILEKWLPSAETSTVSEETSTNTSTDLISRDDAIALVIKAIHGTDNEEIKEYLFDGLRKQMWSLPSAESTGAMDEAIQEYIKDGYMQPIGEDLISRQAAIEAVWKLDRDANEYVVDDAKEIHGYCTAIGVCVGELSALPSAPDSRQRGEWVWGGTIMDIGDVQVLTCDVCRKTILWVDNYDPNDEEPKYCPNCGADMRGEEE